MGTEAAGSKFPLVKRESLSGIIKYLGVDVLVLDGHNNRGFSEGPGIAYDSARKGGSVISIISGHLLETRKITTTQGK